MLTQSQLQKKARARQKKYDAAQKHDGVPSRVKIREHIEKIIKNEIEFFIKKDSDNHILFFERILNDISKSIKDEHKKVTNEDSQEVKEQYLWDANETDEALNRIFGINKLKKIAQEIRIKRQLADTNNKKI